MANEPESLREIEDEEWDSGIRLAFGPPSTIDGDPEPDDPTPRLPASRYEIHDELARDSASVLLLARDLEVDRDVTLRVLGGDGNGDETAVRRFLEEAQVGAQLQHPGILPVYGLGLLEDGRAYVASRLVEGETLARLMESGTNAERLLGIVEQAAHALAYAHARGVAHGALAATRIHVGAHGEVVISGWERAVRASWDAHRVEADVRSLLDLLADVLGRSAGGKLDSAGAVARAIGKQLAGREARARKAEVDAARARVLAEEERARVLSAERRARGERAARHRTMVAAAGTLLIAMLGIGAMLWRQGEAEAERRRVEAQVAEAMREAEHHEAAGRWEEARSWAAKASALAGGANARVQAMRGRVERTARIQAEDQALLRDVREILDEPIWKDPSRDLESSFRDHGLDLLSPDLQEAVARLRSRSRVEEILVALNIWFQVDGREIRRRLHAVLAEADPDPWRRGFASGGDAEDLRARARAADVSALSPGTLRLLVCMLLSLGLPREAETVAMEAFRRHPSDPGIALEVREATSWDHLADGTSLGAAKASLCVSAAASAAAVSPEDARIWLNFGSALADLHDDSGAERAYRKALELDPGYGKARRNLAFVLSRLGRFDEARREAERLCAAAPGSTAEAHFLEGQILFREGDDEGALHEFREAVDLSPDEVEYLQFQGWALERLGRYPEAAECMRRIARLAPGTEFGLLASASASSLMGDHDSAVEACRKSIAIDAARPWSHLRLAGVLRRTGRFSEAVASARRAVELDGKYAEYRHVLGHCLGEAGDYEGAVREFREAVRLDPTRSLAGIRLCFARALETVGEEGEAREVLEQAERRAGDTPVGLAAKGYRLYLLGRHEEAIEPLRWALGSTYIESRGYIWQVLMFCVQQAGRTEEGIEICREQIQRSALKAPELAQVLLSLGVFFCQSGRLPEAEASYREAARLDPASHEAWHGLGWVLLRLERPKEVVAPLRRAVGLRPSGLFGPEGAGERLDRLPSGEQLEAKRRWAVAGVWNDLGNAYHLLGRLEEAVSAYCEAARLDAEEIGSAGWFNLSRVLTATGDHAGALDAARRTLAAHPDDPRRLNGLAWMLATSPETELRRPDEAVRLAERAVAATRGEIGAAWNTLGVARYRAGMFEEARSALLRSRRLQGEPNFSHDGFFLAMTCARLGRAEEARGWYDQSVGWAEANAPDDRELGRFRLEAEGVLGIEPGTGRKEVK